MSAPAHAEGFRDYGAATRATVHELYEFVVELFPEPLRFSGESA